MLLKKFKVKNFKNFKDELELDLNAKPDIYDFNENLIDKGIVKNALVLGENAEGKSNLGLALIDIVYNLNNGSTYKSGNSEGSPYWCLNGNDTNVEFEYLFCEDSHEICCKYVKKSEYQFVKEQLFIDGILVINYDYDKNEGFCKLKGAEHASNNINDDEFSYIKFIMNNVVLDKEDENVKLFLNFYYFATRMSYTRSIGGFKNEIFGYAGRGLGAEHVRDYIVKSGSLKQLEKFLKKFGLEENELVNKRIGTNDAVLVKYSNGNECALECVTSTGTKQSICMFFFMKKISDASFIYFDEFDSYLHYDLSVKIMKEVIQDFDAQIIFTSHNLFLINNDYLRPDVIFRLANGKVCAFHSITDKRLKKEHNLEKMYKGGSFN